MTIPVPLYFLTTSGANRVIDHPDWNHRLLPKRPPVHRHDCVAAGVVRVSRHFAVELPDGCDAAIAARRIQLARAYETIRNSATNTALSMETAALVYGWDVLAPQLDVHLVTLTNHSRPPTRIGIKGAGIATSSVFRSRRNYDHAALVVKDGLRILHPIYLIYELLAHADAINAIVTAESGIRIMLSAIPRDNRRRRERAFAAVTRTVMEIANASGDMRYRVRVRRRLDMLSPWSESPGETLTRLRLREAGIGDVTEQSKVMSPRGVFYLDFLINRARIAVEFDGKVKYRSKGVDPASGQESRRIAAFVEEKTRELAVQEYVSRIVRVMWAQLWSDDFTRVMRSLVPRRCLCTPRQLASNFHWENRQIPRVVERGSDYEARIPRKNPWTRKQSRSPVFRFAGESARCG